MKFEKSTRKNKKYMVISPSGKKIHFGSLNMQHYRDRTPLKLYSHLDHNDKESANYYSRKYLW